MRNLNIYYISIYSLDYSNCNWIKLHNSDFIYSFNKWILKSLMNQDKYDIIKDYQSLDDLFSLSCVFAIKVTNSHLLINVIN